MKMYLPALINHLVDYAVEKVAQHNEMEIQDLHEPEITDILVTELPTMLNNTVSQMLGVRFGGCYIHQKPKAHFKTSTGVQTSREIGDLLIVCRQVIGGVETFNATILQMKMHNSGKAFHQITDKGELEQLDLYQHWPVFDCYKNKVKTSFDLYPKSPHQGAQYGLMSRQNPHYQLLIYHSLPGTLMSLYAGLTLGDFLQDFILFQKGRIITSRASRDKDEWSRLVWYLIDTSWMSVYNLKRLNRNNQLRIGGDFFNIYALMTNAKVGPYDMFDKDEKLMATEDVIADEMIGIPLLLIDVDDDYTLRCRRYKDLPYYYDTEFGMVSFS